MSDINAGPQVILVVKDDPGMRTLLLRLLKENGFHAMGASMAARCGRRCGSRSPT